MPRIGRLYCQPKSTNKTIYLTDFRWVSILDSGNRNTGKYNWMLEPAFKARVVALLKQKEDNVIFEEVIERVRDKGLELTPVLTATDEDLAIMQEVYMELGNIIEKQKYRRKLDKDKNKMVDIISQPIIKNFWVKEEVVIIF